jgi:hypothetical protein
MRVMLARRDIRFRSALRGLGWTLSFPLLIAALQLAFAGKIAETWMPGIDLNAEPFAVPAVRKALAEVYFFIGIVLLLHWTLAAILGRGDVWRVKTANLFLILAGIGFSIWMAAVSFVTQPQRLFEPLCPLLNIDQTEPTFGFDGYSDCQIFTPTIGYLLFILMPGALLLSSTLLRVLVSRRRYS